MPTRCIKGGNDPVDPVHPVKTSSSSGNVWQIIEELHRSVPPCLRGQSLPTFQMHTREWLLELDWPECNPLPPLVSLHVQCALDLGGSFFEQLRGGVVGCGDARLGDQAASEDQGGQREDRDPLAASDFQ